MDNITIFLIILIIVLIIIYFNKRSETWVNSGIPTDNDITSKITVDMDYKGAMLSAVPYYNNNLDIPNKVVEKQIKKLQSYQKNYDGPDETPTLFHEEFTLMNPFVHNPN